MILLLKSYFEFGNNNMDILRFLYYNKIGRIISKPLIKQTCFGVGGKAAG